MAQAIADGKPLSEAERYMLSFSESDPDFVVKPAMVDQLAAEISDEDYEAKVVGLLERVWTRDMQADNNPSNTSNCLSTARRRRPASVVCSRVHPSSSS